MAQSRIKARATLFSPRQPITAQHVRPAARQTTRNSDAMQPLLQEEPRRPSSQIAVRRRPRTPRPVAVALWAIGCQRRAPFAAPATGCDALYGSACRLGGVSLLPMLPARFECPSRSAQSVAALGEAEGPGVTVGVARLARCDGEGENASLRRQMLRITTRDCRAPTSQQMPNNSRIEMSAHMHVCRHLCPEI